MESGRHFDTTELDFFSQKMPTNTQRLQFLDLPLQGTSAEGKPPNMPVNAHI